MIMPNTRTARTARKSRTRSTGRRSTLNTGTDKRYVRRDGAGRISESDDQGRSLSTDRRRKASTRVKSGMGDRGDRKTRRR
jgi:hypothetical protein